VFTGIIEAVGRITRITDAGEDVSFVIDPGDLAMADTAAGDSICVNGVCLTVTAFSGNSFTSDLSAETLSCTSLGKLRVNDRVNLERAMRLGDRLGGHLVSGHVDGIGTVSGCSLEGRSTRFTISFPDSLGGYICRKGSVCVDGVSLTVNEVSEQDFSVNIIPHTVQNTIFSGYRPGDSVNLEVDIIARYLERLLEQRK